MRAERVNMLNDGVCVSKTNIVHAISHIQDAQNTSRKDSRKLGWMSSFKCALWHVYTRVCVFSLDTHAHAQG